jgi:hypothetical protein
VKASRKKDRGIDEAINLKEFRVKWGEFVMNDGTDADDIRPMLGLDAYEAPPKPYRLHNRYDTSALHRQHTKLAVDHEIAKLKHNREQMRGFLSG